MNGRFALGQGDPVGVVAAPCSSSGRRWRGLLALALGLAVFGLAADADAAPAKAPAKRAAPPPARAHRATPKPRAAQPPPPARAASTPANAASPPPRVVADAPERPAAASAAPAGAAVVKTEEASAGERTYTFGAQEVEGRLKSPQILYFLRRVRAEFDPAPLGHRSFLLELYDTRRHRSLE